MVTLRKLIYDVREKYKAFSDDSAFSDEHIAFVINNVRNTLSKQQMSNLKRTVPLAALQTICLDLEVDSQCFDEIDVLKSIIPVPGTLDNTGRSDLHRVHAPGSRFVKNINIVDYGRLPYLSSEKYNGAQLYISVDHQSHLVVYNSKNQHLMLEKLEVEGLFEDPEEAYLLSCDYDGKTDFLDTAYPVDAGIVFPLMQQVVQDLAITKQVPEDKINDGEDVYPVQNQK